MIRLIIVCLIVMLTFINPVYANDLTTVKIEGYWESEYNDAQYEGHSPMFHILNVPIKDIRIIYSYIIILHI